MQLFVYSVYITKTGPRHCRVDMSLHSDTLLWFRANQYLLLLLNAACLAEKQQIPILYSLVWPDRGSNPQSIAKNCWIGVKQLSLTHPLKKNGISSVPFEFDKCYNEPLVCNCLFVLYILQRPVQDMAYIEQVQDTKTVTGRRRNTIKTSYVSILRLPSFFCISFRQFDWYIYRTQSRTIRTTLVSALFRQFDSFFGAFDIPR
jgi:hypothetical protein